MNDNVYRYYEWKPKFWIIEEQHVRMFLIIGEKSALLIDTGFGGGDLIHLVKKITSLPLKVVLTHSDRDHTGASEQFEEIFAHPSDFPHIRQLHPKIKKLQPLWGEDIIDLGGITFETVHIPGHTPGSIAFFERGRRLLIGGDSVQEGPIYMFNERRSVEALIASLHKLSGMKDGFDIILSSHNRLEQGPDILEKLICGAEKLLQGELVPIPTGEDTHKRYNSGDVSFYY